MGGQQEVLDAYIRVSQVGKREGDRFQSPGTQREVIAAWAKAEGVRIGAWHEDLDRSGGTMDRPGMNLALRRIDEGRTGGIVVARLDRFARTLLGGLATIRDLDERGARVVSVNERIDPSTPMGRAMLGLLLIMAEWQRDQASEYLAGAQVRAASQGRFPSKPAFGYARDDRGHTVVDEERAAVVRRIFAERVAGRGWREIADGLGRDGVPTRSGGTRWATSTVSGLVRSESYLGTFVGPNDLRIEDAWPPLVDLGTWEAANALRGTRRASTGKQERLLSGIARCAGCRYALIRRENQRGLVSYGCPTTGCPGSTIMLAELVDGHVRARIDERLARYRMEPSADEDPDGHGAGLVKARDQAVRELERWRDDVDMRDLIGDTDYRAGLAARARARDEAEVELAEHRAATGLGAAGLPPDEDVAMAELPWDVQRRVAQALVHSVWVRRSAVGPRIARQHADDRLLLGWRDDPAPPVTPTPRGGPLPGPLTW